MERSTEAPDVCIPLSLEPEVRMSVQLAAHERGLTIDELVAQALESYLSKGSY